MDELVSPFDDVRREPMPLAPRLTTVDGKRLILLSISKPKSAEFLDELERVLEEHGALVARAAKPTFTRPAPGELLDEVASGTDGVIEGLAD